MKSNYSKKKYRRTNSKRKYIKRKYSKKKYGKMKYSKRKNRRSNKQKKYSKRKLNGGSIKKELRDFIRGKADVDTTKRLSKRMVRTNPVDRQWQNITKWKLGTLNTTEISHPSVPRLFSTELVGQPVAAQTTVALPANTFSTEVQSMQEEAVRRAALQGSKAKTVVLRINSGLLALSPYYIIVSDKNIVLSDLKEKLSKIPRDRVPPDVIKNKTYFTYINRRNNTETELTNNSIPLIEFKSVAKVQETDTEKIYDLRLNYQRPLAPALASDSAPAHALAFPPVPGDDLEARLAVLSGTA